MFFKSSKKRVLVIDDDECMLRQVLFRLERHENVKVIKAKNGKKGILSAEKKEPDLIILDWMLPDLRGPAVLKRLKKDAKTKDIPVLMLTGRNKVGDIEDAFRLGAEGYLTKPVMLQRLGEKVAQMLAQIGDDTSH
ncbi:hypothetical protein A9Q99_01660 [Gammaproteobacteria bacterium 45_16_T64]|nr:hypothetical protein A9Q99_01660 [Gammaproteobacteria bacterium 45_16_T64]